MIILSLVQLSSGMNIIIILWISYYMILSTLFMRLECVHTHPHPDKCTSTGQYTSLCIKRCFRLIFYIFFMFSIFSVDFFYTPVTTRNRMLSLQTFLRFTSNIVWTNLIWIYIYIYVPIYILKWFPYYSTIKCNILQQLLLLGFVEGTGTWFLTAPSKVNWQNAAQFDLKNLQRN